MFKRLWLKYFLAYVSVLVLVTSAGIALHSREFATQVEAEHRERGLLLVDVLATGLDKLPAARPGRNLSRAAEDVEVRGEFAGLLAGTTAAPGILFAGIYGAEGTPIVESGKLYLAGRFDPDPAAGNATVVHREASAQVGSYLLLTRPLHPLPGAEVDEASFRLGVEPASGFRQPVGYLRLGFSLSAANARIRQTNLHILSVSVTLVLLGAAIIYGFIRRMMLPIRRLQEATRLIASGNLAHRVEEGSRDEIGQLAQSFNEMTLRLRHSQLQIENHAAQLEEKVASRTQEIQKAYDELKQAQAQLLQSEKMASIGQLAAGVAHEINNPMGFVQSNLGTLRDYAGDLAGLLRAYGRLEECGGVEVAQAQEALGEIRRRREEMDLGFVLSDLQELVDESLEGTERVRRIVRDLRDFSHADQTEKVAFDVNRGLESTLNIVWNELKYKAEVIKDYGDVPEVVGYPMQLNQVFLNILLNAAQAIEGRGRITVRTYQEKQHVWVSITDTGRGMPPDVQKRIFEPFYTTKEPGKGTGLGLSISYSIIERHGGQILVDSNEGAGTTVTLGLPSGQG